MNWTGDLDDPVTPTTAAPTCEPVFTAKVVDVNYLDDRYLFYIESVLISENRKCFAKREYADFEWLHQNLYLNPAIDGVVVPPLPVLPSTSLSNQPQQRANGAGHGDTCQHRREKFLAQQYLELLTRQPELGVDEALKTFLTAKEIPVGGVSRKGLLGRIYFAVEESRRANHTDVDDYFQKERDWANTHCRHIKEMTMNFSKCLSSKEKIVNAYGHLATSLIMGDACLLQSEAGKRANQLFVKLSEILDHTKHCGESELVTDAQLSAQLDFRSALADALKEMHFRRICLLIGYEEANRALSKAKQARQQAAEESRETAQRKFEQCSLLAYREISSFHAQRASDLRLALTSYAEEQLTVARKCCGLLSECLASFKALRA